MRVKRQLGRIVAEPGSFAMFKLLDLLFHCLCTVAAGESFNPVLFHDKNLFSIHMNICSYNKSNERFCQS